MHVRNAREESPPSAQSRRKCSFLSAGNGLTQRHWTDRQNHRSGIRKAMNPSDNPGADFHPADVVMGLPLNGLYFAGCSPSHQQPSTARSALRAGSEGSSSNQSQPPAATDRTSQRSASIETPVSSDPPSICVPVIRFTLCVAVSSTAPFKVNRSLNAEFRLNEHKPKRLSPFIG